MLSLSPSPALSRSPALALTLALALALSLSLSMSMSLSMALSLASALSPLHPSPGAQLQVNKLPYEAADAEHFVLKLHGGHVARPQPQP